MLPARRAAVALAVVVLALAACVGDDADAGTGSSETPTIVVTTNILGDVVENLVGGHAEVVTIMPVGVDPHEFQASARQVNEIREADALVINGAGFEGGLTDVIDAARGDGIPTFEAAPADRPHFFTDPTEVVDAAEALTDFLVAEVPALADADFEPGADAYLRDLRALDDDIEDLLSAVPEEDRVLVTSHKVFGSFADRYGFDVVGTLVPTGSTADAVSGGELAALAATVESAGVPAIFTDTSSSGRLASTLAEEVGDVDVVELFTESLGGPGSGATTYVDMMHTNAERIADALR